MSDAFSIAPVRQISPQERESPRSERKPSEKRDTEPRREIREAERLVAAQDLEGADKLRVRALIEQAKSSEDSGKMRAADRLADRAIQMARRFEETSAAEAAPSEKEQSAESPENEQQSSRASEDESALPEKPRSSVYRDGSDDPGISYKMGGTMTELQAPLAVRMHETSHIIHETQEAVLEGRRVQAGIRILSRIDPGTGKQFIAGGRAMVTLFPNIEPTEPKRPTIDVTG